ncbi:MAG TPA: hypothetical protein V6D29_17545 [Leptolyngbyaceae cyanobacterium]
MLQNKQIVLSTFNGYLDYLQANRPDLPPEIMAQVAATLTQAEFTLQAAEASAKMG